MYSIRSEDDLSKMVHLARKKNILARFVMNGCSYCVNSQPEWDSFKDRYSGDMALAEIESSYLKHFQQMMSNRDPIPVKGYPTIVMIRDSKVTVVPSLQVIQKTKKTKKNKKDTPKTTPKKDTPKTTPKKDTPKTTPKKDTPKTTPKKKNTRKKA
jgi:hypothetical protein